MPAIRRNRIFMVFLGILFPLLLQFPVPAGAEKLWSRVAVIPVISEEEDSTFESMSGAINDTVLLTLKLLGHYDVVEDHGYTAFSEAEVLSYTEEENIDNIIFGTVSKGADDATVITMSVWDRQKKDIVLSVTERAESLLDIFDAADRIVVSLIEGFSGRHIGYGAIRLVPSGQEGGFSIKLGGNLAGINTKELGRVLIGEYALTISQQRIFGEHILFSDTVVVRENETATVPFTIPLRTEEEAEYFNSLDRDIIENWYKQEQINDIIVRIKEAWTLLEEFNREGYWSIQKQKYDDWRVQIVLSNLHLEGRDTRAIKNRNTKTVKNDVEGLIGRFEVVPSLSGPAGSGGTPHHEVHYYELQEPLLTDLYNNRIPVIPRGRIRVDGRRNDWIAVPVLLEDTAGDALKPGSDMVSVKIARDDSQVYTLISFAEESLFSPDGTWYQTFIQIDSGNINLNHYRHEGTWIANANDWNRERWDSKELARGKVVAGRNFLESSFPLSALVNRLGTQVEYTFSAQGGRNGKMLDAFTEKKFLTITE
jgi:hypothetical protein